MLVSLASRPLKGSSARTSLLPTPRDSNAWLSKHDARRIKSLSSSRPYSWLHLEQLGICHFSRFSGVDSGYQDLGNTWSEVGFFTNWRQWTQGLGGKCFAITLTGAGDEIVMFPACLGPPSAPASSVDLLQTPGQIPSAACRQRTLPSGRPGSSQDIPHQDLGCAASEPWLQVKETTPWMPTEYYNLVP